uniref:Histidine decarboxylase n=1 Tax=Neogobius melanostomus TaxID=47308 RepID=A0A8C6WSU8_9GOBI
MQAEEYNRRGKELVDYITQYLGSIRERRVIPDVKPGYMRDLIPESAPVEAEDWDNIFNDIERVIMPGVVHWQSPYMHAYYPSLTSWPSLLGDMLADAINCVGFTWASSPACTELEMNVMDWLCKALGLPSFFLHHHPDSRGGGILQSTVSESTLVALLAARKDKILQLRAELDQDVDDSILNSRLVAYASDQVCATLGTTGVCAFDRLSELGPICAVEELWLHVDAAYAGSAYFCPELRWSLDGIDFADSFVFNPSKWMMVHFDCTAFWLEDKLKLQQTFSVDPVYLRHENSQGATDFMHWQIPLSRRFRSLKLWFVLRSFGLKNLQAHIRHVRLFETHIRNDPNFEIPAQRHLGLVVFCLKVSKVWLLLTRSGSMYMIPAEIRTKRIIRFTVTSQVTTEEDILRDWGIISKTAAALLSGSRSRSGEDEVIQVGEESPTDKPETEEQEDDVLTALDSRHVELWIDKAWTRTRRPMRSLSCNSEPLPYIYNLGCNCDQNVLFKESATATQAPTPTTSTGPMYTITERPSSEALGKQVLKKLTKFYSVPSFCNPWVQCGRHPLCCPLKANQGNQKHLSSSCRRINCVSNPVAANTVAPPNTPLENGAKTAL